MDAYYIYIGDLRDADDLIGIDPKDNPFRVMGLPGKNTQDNPLLDGSTR